MNAELVLGSCGTRGRVPRRAQRRAILFFWPTVETLGRRFEVADLDGRRIDKLLATKTRDNSMHRHGDTAGVGQASPSGQCKRDRQLGYPHTVSGSRLLPWTLGAQAWISCGRS